MAAHQALPSLGFSRQEHWSGLPFPSPMHESEKWKWSHSVMSDSSQRHGLQPTRLLHPQDKAYGGDGIPADLCKILKYDAVKVLQSICQQIWKTQQCSREWKVSVFIPIPKKGNAKECTITVQLYSFYTPARLCSKSFKLDFKSMWIENFQMYKLDLEKAEEPDLKLPTYSGS